MSGDLHEDFYECPETGELVYRWSSGTRMVLLPATELRRLRAIAEAAGRLAAGFDRQATYRITSPEQVRAADDLCRLTR